MDDQELEALGHEFLSLVKATRKYVQKNAKPNVDNVCKCDVRPAPLPPIPREKPTVNQTYTNFKEQSKEVSCILH